MQKPTRVYFDHAATTPLSEAARRAMEPFQTRIFGNASSPYEVARTARMAVDEARGRVAALIGAHADEVVFTSGGTESDNWVLLGVALRNLEPSSQGNLDRRGHIIISAIEHHAVLEAAQTVRDLGFEVEAARVDGNGVVAPEEIARLLRPDTLLVSVMAVNNEIGTIQPVADISRILRERATGLQEAGHTTLPLLHTDAVQAAGKLPLDVSELSVDLMSLSAHKFGGPKGVGALYIRRGVRMQSLLRGGGQERGRRAGTENVPAIVGMGAAAKAAQQHLATNAARLESLRERLENGLRVLGGVTINGEDAPRAPHITNVSLAGARAESLALNLDLMGFAVGTGSACASGALEPSHVLIAMGHDQDQARASLRISLGPENTADEVDEFLAVLEEIANRKDRKGRKES
jgi:cysteine desulfurase